MVRSSDQCRGLPANITICLRAMLHNEADYPNPEIFRPERFLKEGKLDNNVRDPIVLSFGFGRR